MTPEHVRANDAPKLKVSHAYRTPGYCGRFCDKGKTLSEPRSVLVVEDEYLLATELKETLTHAGFATDIVSSGEEALTLFNGANPYRALATDVCLRGSVSGWELAKRIRKREPALPIVYVTSASAAEWALQGVPNSVLISKP
jgi:CheY-like chemotaxis protein